MEYTKISYGCGCAIKHDDGKDYRIEYCAKHKASPDLYEALKQIVDWMEKWGNAEWNFNGMLIDGREAIAKAEGSSLEGGG